MQAVLNTYQQEQDNFINTPVPDLLANRYRQAQADASLLQQYRELPHFPAQPHKNRISLEFAWSSNDRIDGLTLFDALELSTYIPVLRYTFRNENLLFIADQKYNLLELDPEQNKVTYTKTWSGQTKVNQLLSLFPAERINNQVLYFSLWTLTRNPTNDDDAKFFILGYIDLTVNKIVLKSLPLQAEVNETQMIELVNKRLTAILPSNIRLHQPQLIAYDINFSYFARSRPAVNEAFFEPLTFYFFNHTLDLAREFVILPERGKPSGAQKSITLKAVVRKWDPEDQTIISIPMANIILNPSNLLRKVDKYERGWPILKVQIRGLRNDPNYEQDLIRSMAKYLDYYTSPYRYPEAGIIRTINQMQLDYAGTLGSVWDQYWQRIINKKQETMQKLATQQEDPLEVLKRYLPDLGNRYTKHAGSIPQVIDLEDIGDIDFSGPYPTDLNGYRVLPYPADNPEFYIVCNQNGDNIYPTVRATANDMVGFSREYFPKCIATDPEEERSGDFQRFYRGQRNLSVNIQPSTFVLEARKLFNEDRLHRGPLILNDLLNVNNYDDVAYIGTVPNNNIFLHGIVVALETPGYMEILNNLRLKPHLVQESTVEYVKKLRSNLDCYVHPGAGAQENWNYSEQQLQNELRDNDVYLDPHRFVHILEEIFNINIFIFRVDPQNINNLYLQLPAFRHFPIKRYGTKEAKRLSLVFLNLEQKLRNVPVYAPVAMVNYGAYDRRAYFYPKEAQQLFQLRELSLGLYDTSFGLEKLQLRSNLYDHIDPLSWSWQPNAQIIDAAGKCRGLVYADMTLITPPMQPYNLPKADANWPIAKLEVMTQRLGPPTAIGNDGIWYGIFYFMTDRQPAGIVKGKNNPLKSFQLGPAHRLRILKRKVGIITQILRWLFIISGQDPTTFWQQWIFVDNSSEDSNMVYDLGTLTAMLPNAADVKQGLLHLQQYAPSLVRQGKFYVYNAQLAKKLQYFLLKVEEQKQAAEQLPVPNKIIHWYTHSDDFQHQLHNTVFLNQSQLQSWLGNRKQTQDSIFMTTKLEWNLADKVFPYFYRNGSTGQLMLVVNVYGGLLKRALTVAQTWHETGKNLGFTAEVHDDLTKDYVILTINVNKDLSYVEGSNRKISILQYSDQTFAALCPISK